MATRARVAVVTKRDDKDVVRSIYTHYDGYPSGVGVVLNRKYATLQEAEALVSLGAARGVVHGLAGHIAEAYPYIFRGEELDVLEHDSLEQLFEDRHMWEDYLYVFAEGAWAAYDTYDGDEAVYVVIPELSAEEQHALDHAAAKSA